MSRKIKCNMTWFCYDPRKLNIKDSHTIQFPKTMIQATEHSQIGDNVTITFPAALASFPCYS